MYDKFKQLVSSMRNPRDWSSVPNSEMRGGWTLVASMAQLMLILIFVQFIPHKEQISFQIKNLGLSLPCPFVSVVPKLHQRFSVFILQGAIILQRLAASQQFLTLCRQSLLILLSELLQSSRIHSRFILEAADELVFPLQLGEKGKEVFAEAPLRLLRSSKLGF